jgi:glycosyltransferase involved in cell wall biosynthesis
VTPYFSTIIPTFNRGKLIRSTLDSALAQSNREDSLQEIIVVDDGSTDDTLVILAEYQALNPGLIRYIRQDNAGPGAARNRGLREARGNYIAFLDSDDLWFPHALRTYRSVIEQNQSPSVVIGSAIAFSEIDTLPCSIASSELIITKFTDFFSTAELHLWHGCSAVVALTDALRTAGGFTERNINAEDTDLWLKLGTAPGVVILRSPATVGYREHSGGVVRDMTKTREGMLYLIRQETSGCYPGGKDRRAQRMTMLTRHLRAASMHCLAAGQTKDAWLLYRAS